MYVIIYFLLSHPTRGEWIEISSQRSAAATAAGSHPTRGEWIEIGETLTTEIVGFVSPHTG